MKESAKKRKENAYSLFPELFREDRQDHPLRAEGRTFKQASSDLMHPFPAEKRRTQPPPPPDISWLTSENHDTHDQDAPEDLPSALILAADAGTYEHFSATFEKFGYRIESAQTTGEAVHRISSFPYAAVALHSSFVGGDIGPDSPVHSAIIRLPMEKRRLMYYILAGPQFHTFYALQALACSANLVVNDNHLDKLTPLLRKSLREYEELFAPLLQVMDKKYR